MKANLVELEVTASNEVTGEKVRRSSVSWSFFIKPVYVVQMGLVL